MFRVKSCLGETKHPISRTMAEAVYHHIKVFGVQRLGSAKVLNASTLTVKAVYGINRDAENMRRIRCRQVVDIAESDY